MDGKKLTPNKPSSFVLGMTNSVHNYIQPYVFS